jgi:hypothetical protein
VHFVTMHVLEKSPFSSGKLCFSSIAADFLQFEKKTFTMCTNTHSTVACHIDVGLPFVTSVESCIIVFPKCEPLRFRGHLLVFPHFWKYYFFDAVRTDQTLPYIQNFYLNTVYCVMAYMAPTGYGLVIPN